MGAEQDGLATVGPSMADVRRELVRAIQALDDVAENEHTTHLRSTLFGVAKIVEGLGVEDPADELSRAVDSLRGCAASLLLRDGTDALRAAVLPSVTAALDGLEEIETLLSGLIDPDDRSTIMLSLDEALRPDREHQLRESGSGVQASPHGLPPVETMILPDTPTKVVPIQDLHERHPGLRDALEPSGFGFDFEEREERDSAVTTTELDRVTSRTGDGSGLADQMARDALRELGQLREQRRPSSGEHWRARESAEQRLTERIDLVAALGPLVLARLESAHVTMDAPMAFALAVGLGCTDDPQAVARAAGMLRRRVAAEGTLRAAIEEGLLLASSPSVREGVSELLSDDDPDVVAAAARVLLARDELLVEEARALVQRAEPELIALGVRGLDGDHDPESLELVTSLLAHTDDGVLDSVLGMLVMAGDDAWRPRSRELCASGSGDVGRASMWLAIAGGSEELESLLTAAARTATPIELDSLGVFGHRGAVPFLLGLLEASEPAVAEASALALERITGAGLTEADIVDVDVDLDIVSPPTVEVGTRTSRSPIAWRAWWEAHEEDFDPEVRWRYGRPFSPAICLEELAERNCTPPDRVRAHYELRVASALRIPFDPGWLLERQQVVFEQWRAWWARTERRWANGRWPGLSRPASMRPSTR